MKNMSRDNQKVKTSLSKVGYALVSVVDGSYQTIVWHVTDEEGGREYTADPKGDAKKLYADGKEVYSEPGNDGYDIKLTLLAATDTVETAWYSCFDNEGSNGVVEISTAEENPHFALILVEDTTDGEGVTNIFYDCQCSGRPSITGKTKEGSSWDAQFPEYPITARARETDGLVRYRINGKLDEKTTKLPMPASISSLSAAKA